MPYTLGQAAKATGKQKSTILDAIRNGRLSASRDDKKQWQIDPAELHRVYAPTVQDNDSEREETPLNHSEMALLRQHNDHLKAQLATLEGVIADLRTDRDDLRSDRDHWRRQATHLLTHQPQPQPEAPPAPAPQPEPAPAAAATAPEEASGQTVPDPPRRGLWATIKKWV